MFKKSLALISLNMLFISSALADTDLNPKAVQIKNGKVKINKTIPFKPSEIDIEGLSKKEKANVISTLREINTPMDDDPTANFAGTLLNDHVNAMEKLDIKEGMAEFVRNEIKAKHKDSEYKKAVDSLFQNGDLDSFVKGSKILSERVAKMAPMIQERAVELNPAAKSMYNAGNSFRADLNDITKSYEAHLTKFRADMDAIPRKDMAKLSENDIAAFKDFFQSHYETALWVVTHKDLKLTQEMQNALINGDEVFLSSQIKEAELEALKNLIDGIESAYKSDLSDSINKKGKENTDAAIQVADESAEHIYQLQLVSEQHNNTVTQTISNFNEKLKKYKNRTRGKYQRALEGLNNPELRAQMLKFSDGDSPELISISLPTDAGTIEPTSETIQLVGDIDRVKHLGAYFN